MKQENATFVHDKTQAKQFPIESPPLPQDLYLQDVPAVVQLVALEHIQQLRRRRPRGAAVRCGALEEIAQLGRDFVHRLHHVGDERPDAEEHPRAGMDGRVHD